jgi:hypothetical protein
MRAREKEPVPFKSKLAKQEHNRQYNLDHPRQRVPDLSDLEREANRILRAAGNLKELGIVLDDRSWEPAFSEFGDDFIAVVDQIISLPQDRRSTKQDRPDDED